MKIYSDMQTSNIQGHTIINIPDNWQHTGIRETPINGKNGCIDKTDEKTNTHTSHMTW